MVVSAEKKHHKCTKQRFKTVAKMNDLHNASKCEI